jgi:alkyl sulfatase BDS1-like metallo-beta-lactamase superfamily hydrolase
MPAEVRSAELVAALTIEQVFDSIAIRIDGPRSWDEAFVIDWVFTDVGVTYRTQLTNGVLIPDVDPDPASSAGLRVTLTRAQLGRLLGGDLAGIELEGDADLLGRLVACIDHARSNFAIVTP